MSILLFIIIAVFVIGYISVLIYFLWIWIDMPRVDSFLKMNPGRYASSTSRYVSIIIPVRNEEKNIALLLKDLAHQSFPKDRMEILIINDSSTDQTVYIVNQFINQNSDLSIKIIDLVVEGTIMSYKKKAIELGIAHAKGEIIVTTDGDCRVNHHWIQSICSFMRDKNAFFVSGPVQYIVQKNLVYYLQQIELAALILVGAVCMKKKIPSMCNGANMAYLKSIFKDVEGYKHVDQTPSGDDEFLMHKILKKYPDHVFFLKDTQAIVSTYPHYSFQPFIHQRKRWAGKWRLYQDARTKWIGIATFTINLLFVMSVVFYIGHYLSLIQIGCLWGSKLLIENRVSHYALRFFSKRNNFFVTALFSLLYPFYIIVLGVLINFGTFDWKGRTVST